MSISDEYVYWLDLETTGLNEFFDDILEVAVVRARFDDPCTPLATFHAVLPLRHGFDEWVKGLDPKVVDMHTKSGLFDECRKATRSIHEVNRMLCDFLPMTSQDDGRDGKLTLVGNCVAAFDLKFLLGHMPEVGKRFMNRALDVSAIKLFCRTLGMEKLPKAEAHRAMADIEESMRDLRLCRNWLAQPETAFLGWGRR